MPLLQEDYYLVCLKAALEQPPIRALRELLRSAAWQRRLATLPGYQPAQCGQVLSLSERLPWWQFADSRKSARPRRSGKHGSS